MQGGFHIELGDIRPTLGGVRLVLGGITLVPGGIETTSGGGVMVLGGAKTVSGGICLASGGMGYANAACRRRIALMRMAESQRFWFCGLAVGSRNTIGRAAQTRKMPPNGVTLPPGCIGLPPKGIRLPPDIDVTPPYMFSHCSYVCLALSGMVQCLTRRGLGVPAVQERATSTSRSMASSRVSP